MRQILTSRLSLSKHWAHNLGNLLLLGKIGFFHNRRNASSRLLPYTTLFRSPARKRSGGLAAGGARAERSRQPPLTGRLGTTVRRDGAVNRDAEDRKSTRLNSSHSQISYAVFCLKKNRRNASSRLLLLISKHL